MEEALILLTEIEKPHTTMKMRLRQDLLARDLARGNLNFSEEIGALQID